MGGNGLKKRGLLLMATLTALALIPRGVQGGWIMEWETTAVRPKGQRFPSELVTMYIDKGRIRTEQPSVITLVDYDKGLFTILNPTNQFFWSGKVEEYVSEATKNRAEQMRRRVGSGGGLSFGRRKIDEKALPRVEIKKTAENGAIAGYRATKYEVFSNGELFQEMWFTQDIDMARDLDSTKSLEYECKRSAGMLGRTAGPFNALYRSSDYADLLKKGNVLLASIVYHGAGSFEKKATSVREAEIPASKFEVPENYRRVRLQDVFPPTEQGEKSDAH